MYVGLCMAMKGYVGLCIAIYGYLGLFRAMYGYVIIIIIIKYLYSAYAFQF